MFGQCWPQVLIYFLSPCSWWNNMLRIVLILPYRGGHACMLRPDQKIIICLTFLPGFCTWGIKAINIKGLLFTINWFSLISFYSELSILFFLLVHFRDVSFLCFTWHVRMEIIYQKWWLCWCFFLNKFYLLLYCVCLCICEYITCVQWHSDLRTDF